MPASVTDYVVQEIAALFSEQFVFAIRDVAEQANVLDIDSRSDLFCLGSVVCAMCAGQAAFQADSPLAISASTAENRLARFVRSTHRRQAG